MSLTLRERLDGTHPASSLEHWKQRLAGAAPAVLPPYSKTQRKPPHAAPSSYDFQITPPISNAVARTANEAGVTPSDIYFAAFAVLLFRYSAQTDLCIGTAAADIAANGFNNTLPIRVDLGGEPTFREVVGRVSQAMADVVRHADFSLQRIYDALRPGLAPDADPLFRTAFAYQTDNRTSRGQTKCDLSLRITDSVGGVVADIEYNNELYQKADARRIAGHYLTLIDQAALHPEMLVSQLPLLGLDEYRQIVCEWNLTAGPYPADVCIQQQFEERARECPDHIAIIAGGREFSFRELDERANRLAHFLLGQGLLPGSFTGVCLSRSEEMIVAVLAVLKAGGAYLPLDATYPKDRLGFMLQEAGTALVLTQSSLLDRLPNVATPVDDAPPRRYLCLDCLGDEREKQSCQPPAQPARPDAPAYVIFTSGSTGRPKGVVLRHGPVANVLDWANETFDVSASDRILFITSLSFDLSVYDIFGVLGAGASVRIANEEELRDPTALLDILKTEPITIWNSAPAALSQLSPFFESCGPADGNGNGRMPAALRLVMLSGDWIPVQLPDQVSGEFPRARVVGLGGATEAAIWSNWYPIERVDPSWTSIPYGKPIRNARYHILDAHLQPVPVGVSGELHIGGPVLADGYLQRRELTAQRFIVDPFAATTTDLNWPRGDKLYKTGDLARYLPDGNIELLGRIDNQVKVRGFRAEVGEIEAALSQQVGVQHAIVKPHRDASGQNYLVAYVVAQAGRSLEGVRLIQTLHKTLPEYMVPSQVVFLDALPLTQNGKVDRAVLAAPNLEAGRTTERECIPPASDAERALLAIWEEILGIHPIGVTDDFHTLGGHSLLAASVMAMVESRLGHRIPIEVLLNKATVRGLAEVITGKLEMGGGVLVPLHTGGSHPPLFMIAGAGGHVFAFHAFARRLGPQFNVYGMRAVGIDGTEPPLDSVPEIAARYLDEIRAACPNGPYVLGGYSVGGIIAFELAQQMQAAAMEVSRVVIFDLPAPGYPKLLPLWHRLYLHCRKILKMDWQGKRTYLRERIEKLHLRIFHGRYAVSPEEVPGIDIIPAARVHAVLSRLLKAWSNYWPQKPFDGQLVMVSSTIPVDWLGSVFDDPCKGWSRWTTRPLKLYQVDAPHTEFFNGKYVEQVERHIREVLESAQAQQELVGAPLHRT